MVNLKLIRILYNELKDDYCSIRYLTEKTPFSKQYIWNNLRVFKALSLVDERYSNTKANVRVYKLKNNIIDFDKFVELYTEKI